MADSIFEVGNRVRQSRGLPPIDPMTIEGFGEGAPAPPPYVPTEVPSAEAVHGPPIEQDEPGEWLPSKPTSALVPGAPAFVPPVPRETSGILLDLERMTNPEPTPDPLAKATTIVVDGRAIHQGHEVGLNESEQAQVTYVILRAILRSIREQESEIAGKLPKRKRKVGAVRGTAGRRAEKGEIPAPVDSAPTPKKRGRPRKVKEAKETA